MHTLSDYEGTLLAGWEEVHKKGQLSLWILLALKDGAKYMGRIKVFIADATNHTITPDDKSMYRALRRFTASEIVDYEMIPSDKGPDLKIYQLTPTGENVLRAFVKRNISQIFYQTVNRKLIEKG